MSWFVYIVRCKDGSYYTGITTNVDRRIREHNESCRGARYTRNRRPVKLVWQSLALERSFAAHCEYYIKRLSRAKKEAYIKKPEGETWTD